MKAIKRVRYGQKELARLENMLKAAKEAETANENQDTVTPYKVVTPPATQGEEKMDAEVEPRIYNKKTMKDQHGRYPEWMTVKRIRQLKKKNKGKKGSRRR